MRCLWFVRCVRPLILHASCNKGKNKAFCMKNQTAGVSNNLSNLLKFEREK